MVTNEEFRTLALSFYGTEENPHFERQAFKVVNKRIFATIDEHTHTANIKLPASEQTVFCGFCDAVYPVPNKWGQQGWTTFQLKNLPKELITDALETAYNDAIKRK